MATKKKKTYKFRHTETYRGIRIDVKATSTGDLVEKVRRKKAQIDRKTVSPDIRLLRFGEMYLDTYKRDSVSASWYADLRTILETKIVASIGDRQVARIPPMDVQVFLNSCSHLSDSYIKKIFDLTKQIFHQAYKNGLTPTDYSEDLIRPHGKKGQPGRSLTDAETDALLLTCSGTPDELFLRIMLQCGLRPGEVVALTWRDIDLDAGTLSVNKAMKKDSHVGLPKSDAGNRTVPIPADLLTRMNELYDGGLGLVCPKQSGGFHTKSSLRKLWDRTQARIDAELNGDGPVRIVRDPLRLYDLRHTYCTNLERACVPINIACRLMGHSDISVTSKIYTHASEEALEMARNLIDQRTFSGSKMAAE
ncbi:MAG: site-specific integrase [Lachnospiraceae bacterium]|nr:site-specific integrase [Lachnospiraceae bacterium]